MMALADRHWAAMRSTRAYELTPHARHAQAILILSDPFQLLMLATDFGRAACDERCPAKA